MTIPLIQRSGPFQQLQEAVQSVMAQRQQRQAQALQMLTAQTQLQHAQGEVAMQPLRAEALQAQTDQSRQGTASDAARERARIKAEERADEVRRGVEMGLGPITALVARGVDPSDPQITQEQGRILAQLKDPDIITGITDRVIRLQQASPEVKPPPPAPPTPVQLAGMRRKFPALATVPDQNVTAAYVSMIETLQREAFLDARAEGRESTLAGYLQSRIRQLTQPRYDMFGQPVPSMTPSEANRQARSEYEFVAAERQGYNADARQRFRGRNVPLPDADMEQMANAMVPMLDASGATPAQLTATLQRQAQAAGRPLSDDEARTVLLRSRMLRTAARRPELR
jgi:hypothetical protein